MKPLTKAMRVVIENIRSDPGYRIGWISNIAMAYADNPKQFGESDHEWRNRCAEAFIDVLCRVEADETCSNYVIDSYEGTDCGRCGKPQERHR